MPSLERRVCTSLPRAHSHSPGSGENAECRVSEQRRSGNEEGERYRECGCAAVSWRDLEHKPSLGLSWENRA